MSADKLQMWLKEDESEKLEFKTSFGQDTIETLAAFANAKGGIVLAGVADNGEIRGVNLAIESINRWINEIKSKTAPQLVPDVEIFEIENKTVVSFAIAEYPVKPVACKGRYYKRVANTNRQLSIQDVVNIHLQSVNSSWDFYIRPNRDITQISLDKVNRQIERINQRKQVPIEDPLTFLRKYGLIEGEKITNACWLLFLPDQEITTTIELGHFASETVIKDSLTLKTDLFTEVEEVMNFIRKHINKEIIITGNPQNTERWEYPLDAIRELVLNMIVHRDYTSSYDSVIKIFNDHIEFYNPGALPDTISIEQLLSDNYTSRPRNKQVAEIFKEAGLIEKYGSGVRRVRQEFIDYGLPAPVFKDVKDGMFIIAYGTKYADIITEKVGESTENDLEKVGENEKVTEKVTEKTGNDLEKIGEKVTENEKLPEKVGEKAENDLEKGGENKKVTEKVTENGKLPEKVTENQQLIIDSVSKNPHITSTELAAIVGITAEKIRVNISKLKEKGLLERIGPDKGGYWEIKNKPHGR